MKEVLTRIAKHYGYEAQSRQMVEEMAELTVAINKFWRKQLRCGMRKFPNEPTNTKEEDAIIEEIADVEIMLEQMKILLECEEEVEIYKESKVKRQLERIKRYE